MLKALEASRRGLRRLEHAGIGPEMPGRLARRLVLLNRICLLMAAASLFFAVINLFFGTVSLILVNLLFAAFGLGLIGLNALGRSLLSRLLMIAVANLGVFFFATSVGREGGAHLVYFVSMVLPAMFFEARGRVNRLAMFVGMLLPVIGYTALELTGFSLFARQVVDPAALAHIYEIETYVALLLVAIAVSQLHRSNDRAEQELLDEKDFSDAILDTTSALILVTRVDGSIVRVNRAFVRLTRYDPAELLARGRVEDLFEPEDLELVVANFSRVLKEPGTSSILNRLRTRSGELRWIEWNATAVRGASGEIEHVIGTGIDVTEKRETESKLVTASKMSSLGEMASGIAHELNNPLAVVLLTAGQFVDLADEGPIEPGRARDLGRKIESMVERVSKIVVSLRTFAREGSRDPFETVRLDALIEDTLGFCRERFKHHGVELTIALPATALTIDCQPVQVSQILLNLLNNAFDAVQLTPDPRRWIRLEAMDLGDQVAISVTDGGRGIAAAHHDRVFEPFFTTKPPGKGTGLGLSISRAIAESHGGAIELDRSHAHTRMVLTLPKRAELSRKGSSPSRRTFDATDGRLPRAPRTFEEAPSARP